MRGLLIPPAATTTELDVGGRYRLDPQVALRPERFGALAYHYGNRRLNFLRSPLLAALVSSLGDHPSVQSALDAAVPVAQHDAHRRALTALAASGFIQPFPTPPTPGEDRDDHPHD